MGGRQVLPAQNTLKGTFNEMVDLFHFLINIGEVQD